MGSYSGTCEIVEAREDTSSSKHQGGKSHAGFKVIGDDRKPPVLKLGYKESLEDDINQLFEAISLKSSKGLGYASQASTSAGASPLRKNAMKRPITVPHSPGFGNSEAVSLKQALRELCISKASEMAAQKRLSKSINSPRISEAGRIKSLYNSVVVETGRSGFPVDADKESMVEISLVLEESKPKFSDKISQHHQLPRIRPMSQSAQSSPRFLSLKSPNQSVQSSPRFQAWKSPNQSVDSSPRFAAPITQYGLGSSSMRNESASTSTSVHIGPQASKSPNPSTLSSPRFAVPKLPTGIGSIQMQNEVGSAPRKIGSQALRSPTQSTQSSPQLLVPTSENGVVATRLQNDAVFASGKVGAKSSKTDNARKEKHIPVAPVSGSNSSNGKLKPSVNVPSPTKGTSKASIPISVRKVRVHSASSSNANKVNKLNRNSSRVAKPVIRNKGSGKKKIRQGATSPAHNPNDGNKNLVPNTGQLVCEKCRCTLKDAIEESSPDLSPSFGGRQTSEVSFGNVKTIESKQNFASSNHNRNIVAGKANAISKSREKGEFSQSSKSSLGDFSTSTSNSDESNASRPSCCNRPHMSKDFRWEAIRYIKMRDGGLSLRHFNLLKKLGCGDIGTVYLAELIGSSCLFAIKVMDNEFLARRKKMPRAQTEREILRMLDHPFLPTLYSQFTSDNLSCLVMEYCPGGDLHVLRQRQPGRSFPEPAARFYVAEVLLALEYLHMLGVVYRDLKPENILVREDGHIMLTDFDLSLRCDVNPTLLKSSSTDRDPARISGPCTQSSCMQPFCVEPACQVSCFSPKLLPAAAKARKLKAEMAAHVRSLPQLVAEPSDARSNSFVGTHEYLAPEIIKGEGHGAAVDWWTFGVFLYELLYGKTPFKGAGNEETLANVVLQSLKFPDTPLVSLQARDLIRGLLVKEPENRLGTEKGAAEIKQHPFFEGLNWALIRCAIPPELPDFYDFGVPNLSSHEKNSNYLECKATGEHLEFELF